VGEKPANAGRTGEDDSSELGFRNRLAAASVYLSMRVGLSFAMVCLSGLVFAQGSVSRSNITGSRRVEAFEIQNRNMIDALLILGQREHIGIGIDYIDDVALERRITLQLHQTTLAEVLDAITRYFGYRWSSHGRVVTVTHSGAIRRRRNLLNRRIATFKVSTMPLELAGCRLRSAFYFGVHLKSVGLVGDCPYGGAEQTIDGLDMKNATVRQILDALIAQRGNGAWIVQQPPGTMDKDLGYGFWKLLAYDRPDGQYSRSLQIRGLGLPRP
jgi:hypothetical protein